MQLLVGLRLDLLQRTEMGLVGEINIFLLIGEQEVDVAIACRWSN